MEKMITGFQWSPIDGRYIGEYKFQNNLDREEIHLPPFTTLDRPPEAPAGSTAYRRDGKWVVDIDPSQVKTRPPIDDYLMLMPGFIQHLKDEGLWTEEDEQKLKDAIAENDRKKAEYEARIAAAMDNKTTTEVSDT